MTTLIPKYDLKNGGSTPTGAVNRTIAEKFNEYVSVKDFGAKGDGTTDDTTAFISALAYIATTFGTLFVPQGNYLISDSGAVGLTLSNYCGINFAPNTKITYNGTAAAIFNVKNGTQFVGNGVTINITNTSWNGVAVLFDGASHYADDFPCAIDGVNVLGADITKGTGLGLTATNATNFISFVRFSNFTFNNLNFGLTLSVGSSGSAGDNTTWHWINGNVFENFNFYGTTNGVNINSLTGVPAECAGNIFNNFEFQIGTSASHFPVYVSGGSSNTFNNCYIWDWNVATSNPVQFVGSASVNQFNGNIDPTYVTHNGVNSVYHNGAGLYTNITVDGNIKARGATATLQVGYDGSLASITNNGSGPLVITPTTGYNTSVASQFVPTVDNTYALGGSSARWTVVYAATGTINTSDERAKQDIKDLSELEKKVAIGIKGLIKSFRFKDAVATKGDKARIHFGVMAQQVAEAFKIVGLDPNKYAMFCYDEWEDDEKSGIKAGNRYGIRYDELLAFVISAL